MQRPNPCFLDELDRVHRKGRPRWRSDDRSLLYEWDPLHGHVEIYDRRGNHRGVADARTGVVIGPAVRGRSIDV
jgi:hypothetical protein